MKRFIGFFLVFVVWFWVEMAYACPKAKDLEESLKALFGNQPFQVVEVRPTEVKGICEVIIESRGRKKLTYTDETGRYLIVGRLIDIKARKDLTQARIAELNRLSPEQMKELEKLVAFTAGNKGPVVYLVTDPDCPHCKRAEKILLPLVKEGKIQVKVIIMPLEAIHPEAKAKAVSIICEKKGLEGLISGYKGKQCEAGKQKVEAAIKTLPQLGIRATPTYIFSDGRVMSGVLEAERLLSLAR